MNRHLAIYVNPDPTIVRYEFIRLGEKLNKAGIHINYFSSMSSSRFEIETNNVRILFVTLNRFNVKGYHPNEIFGWYHEDYMLRRKNPNKPPYKGELFEYIKEIEDANN